MELDLSNVGHPETSDGVLKERGFGRRKDYIIAKSDPHGSFSFAIELENMFGFCEDYDKVVYGMRHNDATIFKVAATAKGKVELTLAVWVMLRVHPNDVKKFSLYKSIESKIVLGRRIPNASV